MNYEIDTETPMPSRASVKKSRYDKLLDSLKVGQSVKTKDPYTAKKVHTSLSGRIKARKLNHLRVALRANMNDGYSRVFLIERETNKKPVTPKPITKSPINQKPPKHIPDHRVHRIE